MLRTDKGVRIPRRELTHPDVAKLTELMNGNCTQASVRSAISMFVQAVRDCRARERLRCGAGREPAHRYRRDSSRRCDRGDTSRVVVAAASRRLYAVYRFLNVIRRPPWALLVTPSDAGAVS